MTDKRHEWALQNAMDLESFPRYAYTVNRIREAGLIWLLNSEDGWVLGADPEERQVIPVWPSCELASIHATQDWNHAYPESLTLDRWLSSATPKIKAAGIIVGVFPVPPRRWVPSEPELFASHLKGSYQKLYDLPEWKTE